jgi:hypothetical protein
MPGMLLSISKLDNNNTVLVRPDLLRTTPPHRRNRLLTPAAACYFR